MKNLIKSNVIGFLNLYATVDISESPLTKKGKLTLSGMIRQTKALKLNDFLSNLIPGKFNTIPLHPI
jgi:hypothetical protein